MAKKLSNRQIIVYNKFKANFEKPLHLKILAKAIYDGNPPKEMTMGTRYNEIWMTPIRLDIYGIRQWLEERIEEEKGEETIVRAALHTYILTKKNSRWYREWTGRQKRADGFIHRSDRLLQSINPNKLPGKVKRAVEDVKPTSSHLHSLSEGITDRIVDIMRRYYGRKRTGKKK